MSVNSRWQSRLQTRRGLLEKARREGDKGLIAKREKQVNYAKRVLKRHPLIPLRVKALNEAQKDLGIVESGGNNRGKEVERIIKEAGGQIGEPWCGDAVFVWYKRGGSKMVSRAWAAVRLLERLLMKVRRPKPGHVVIYDFDHTGLFVKWVNKKDGTFVAREGNTGTSGAVSDSPNGNDGVRDKLRTTSQVSSFRRVLR